ncbi:MAG: hypothetical protein DI539_21425, partial [Flavobacterium psychrophilum]
TIPTQAYLVEGDNKLLINFENMDSTLMFAAEIKGKINVIMEEFLFSGEAVCQNKQKQGYINEFVFSFHKSLN